VMNGERPVSLLESVAMGIPVVWAMSRCDLPAPFSASVTTLASGPVSGSSVLMGITVVPI